MTFNRANLHSELYQAKVTSSKYTKQKCLLNKILIHNRDTKGTHHTCLNFEQTNVIDTENKLKG